MQSSTSIKQIPEFERCRYNKNGEVIVNLQSVFDGAFANMKIKTISKQVVDAHQRKIKLWEARGTHFFRRYQMDIDTGYTPQRIQAVRSHSKTTQLCTTRRLAQSQHCFGTT
jgi:hypothetical protein